MDFDFCQVLYTAIDEINNFRLRQEDISFSILKNNGKLHNRISRRVSVEIHSALSGGAIHLGDD